MKKRFTPLEMNKSSNIDYGNASARIVKKKSFLSLTGFTLLELMLVVVIFVFLFSAVLVVLTTSDRSWRTGQYKSTEQQEARRVMDNIVRLLRQSKPEWVTISPSGWPNRDKILFYEPVFNEATGEMSPGPWIVFKPDPNNSRLLIKKKEGQDWVPIAQEIEKIKFYGGDCAGCNCNFANPACLACLSVTSNCPLVKI